MVETFFTQVEADQKLGRKVRSASSLPSVPAGTEGTIVQVVRFQANNWRVRVHWRVPRTISLIDAAEFSFLKRDKPAQSDLSKSEYERSVKEIS